MCGWRGSTPADLSRESSSWRLPGLRGVLTLRARQIASLRPATEYAPAAKAAASDLFAPPRAASSPDGRGQDFPRVFLRIFSNSSTSARSRGLPTSRFSAIRSSRLATVTVVPPRSALCARAYARSKSKGLRTKRSTSVAGNRGLQSEKTTRFLSRIHSARRSASAKSLAATGALG